MKYRYPQFFCLQDVLKMSSRQVFRTSSRHVFKTPSRRLQRNDFSCFRTSLRRLVRCLQDIFKTSLQDVFKISWKTKNCYAEDVLKTPSRHVLKTSKCLLGHIKVNYPINRIFEKLSDEICLHKKTSPLTDYLLPSLLNGVSTCPSTFYRPEY